MSDLFLAVDPATKDMWIIDVTKADHVADEIVAGVSATKYYFIDNSGPKPMIRDITTGPAARTTRSVDRTEIIANRKAIGKADVQV